MNEHSASDTAHPTLLLEVLHHTHYRYAAPVSLAHHLAHLQPLQDAHQQLLAFDLHIDPAPGPGSDAVANVVADAVSDAGSDAVPSTVASTQRFFSLLQPHRHLRVRASSRVRVAPRFSDLQSAASPPWDALAAGLRYDAARPYQAAVQYTYPSPYVPRLQALRRYAAASFEPGLPVVQGALRLMQRIHTDFEYAPDSTDIDTPLAEVLKQRRGVCQDFAHLMIGALRMLGLPARYVSGYLLTEPPEGGPAQVGADATHAWVQLWCPGTPGVPGVGTTAGATARATAAAADAAGWLDLDPTNNRVPGAGHVRLALGRDYGDVAPLHGVIRGGGRHSLSVGVTTRVLPSA